MHTNPQREKMSPAAKGREIMKHLRYDCPCCGGDMGIRAAMRPSNHWGFVHINKKMIGQKSNTLRDKR